MNPRQINISTYATKKIMRKIERDFLDPKKQANFKAWKKKKDSQRGEPTIELKIINHEDVNMITKKIKIINRGG